MVVVGWLVVVVVVIVPSSLKPFLYVHDTYLSDINPDKKKTHFNDLYACSQMKRMCYLCHVCSPIRIYLGDSHQLDFHEVSCLELLLYSVNTF